MDNNSAEYVAYLRKGKVWNLNHEFVHYLDGRFNTYGDYCSPLHDNHYGPEYFQNQHLNHLISFVEGMALANTLLT
jgi:hypothetical protein